MRQARATLGELMFIILAAALLLAAAPLPATGQDFQPQGGDGAQQQTDEGAAEEEPDVEDSAEEEPALDLGSGAAGGEGEGEDEGETAAASSPPPRFGLVGAAWCPVVSGGDEDNPLGCDLGGGVALWTMRRVAAVAVVGAKTVGAGWAWVAVDKPPVAVAVGVVAPYDTKTGIDVSRAALALGATLSIGGRP